MDISRREAIKTVAAGVLFPSVGRGSAAGEVFVLETAGWPDLEISVVGGTVAKIGWSDTSTAWRPRPEEAGGWRIWRRYGPGRRYGDIRLRPRMGETGWVIEIDWFRFAEPKGK